MNTKIQYQRNKELETICWNLSNKTIQEHRNHPSCGTWRNKESPVCPSLNQLCLTTTIFNRVKAVHNEPIDGTSLCLQEIEPTPTRIPRRKWSQQAGYLNCWPEPRSTGCSILKCTPTRNPMRKPDSGGDQTEKRTVLPGEPANISESPWKVLELKEDKLADHTSSGRNEHQMRSFSKAGRMVRMVRICQDSRYGEDGEDGQDGEEVQ